MKRMIGRITIGVLCSAILLLSVTSPIVFAGIPSEVVGIENETGSATFDNVIGIGSGEIGDRGIAIAEKGLGIAPQSGKYINIGRAGKFLKWGGSTIGAIDTVRDSYTLVTESSKHSTWVGRWTDKGLHLVGTAMGWATIAGTVVVLVSTAPVTGTAAIVTGTTFAVVSAGVAITRGVVNSDTAKSMEDLAAGKKKLVFAPFERPDIKEARDIIKEELGFDPYDHSDNEIPDPSTGIPVYKPNIYLYSEKDMTVDVKLYPSEWITCSEPLYDANNGWQASIVDGSLNGFEDYLFYEALVPEDSFQKDQGWVIQADSHYEELAAILDEYAFNEKEKKDFLEFWSGSGMLDSKKCYAVYPQDNSVLDGIMPLVVSPTPEQVYRVWFYFVPAETGFTDMDPVKVVKIERNGLTAVEWGGMIKR